MRILVIDDEKSLADTLAMILQHAGYQAASIYDGASALKLVETFVPDCVICDVIMPGMNGIQTCAEIAVKHPGCHILLFSGQAEGNELVNKARADGYTWELLAKPVEPDELLAKIASG